MNRFNTTTNVSSMAPTIHPQAANMFKALAMVAPAPGELVPEERARECVALERVANQNKLACLVADRALGSGTTLQLSFEFNLHRFAPAAVLKSKQATS